MNEKNRISLNDVKGEVDTIRNRHPTFKDDSAFVFWFLIAYLVDKEVLAKESLTGKIGGRGGEKNIDAIYIDEKNRQCNIIQGKFHLSEGCAEKRNDVLSFAELGLLPWEGKAISESFFLKLDPIVLDKFREVINLVKTKKYSLRLYYVTTGKCTNTIIEEAEARVRKASGTVAIEVITLKKILKIFEDYTNDITPHIEPLKLKIVSEGIVQHEGLIHRYDPKTKIESWVLSVSGQDVGEMYAKIGKRLFAKNIRGYLGSGDINNSIRDTINKEPLNFWYYNNGVTIVCDDARRETRGGEDIIIIDGAQVINGQQTTRTLHQSDSRNTNVLVKIIKIPSEYEDNLDYDKLINSIVRATNWQNYIYPSDLVSNDNFQIFLEKELRKVGYQYIRKNMSKAEARSWLGQGYFQIDKKEMAQAIAACLFDPVIVRKGKEGLFEDPFYKSIFSSKQLSYYLSKYWLMKEVQNGARGYPARAYAKWLVLHFLWSKIGSNIGSSHMEKHFRYTFEHYKPEVRVPLQKATVNVFRASLQYYRLNRGKGEEAKDVSTFFNLKNHHTSFQEFWDSRRNTYRDQFKKNINVFCNKLIEIEIE
jgi:hypothetical protein